MGRRFCHNPWSWPQGVLRKYLGTKRGREKKSHRGHKKMGGARQSHLNQDGGRGRGIRRGRGLVFAHLRISHLIASTPVRTYTHRAFNLFQVAPIRVRTSTHCSFNHVFSHSVSYLFRTPVFPHRRSRLTIGNGTRSTTFVYLNESTLAWGWLAMSPR